MSDAPDNGLDKPVQEHLGKELRGIYNVVAEKPAYLGESPLPAALETQLDRLACRLTASELGAAAVSEALQISDQQTDDSSD